MSDEVWTFNGLDARTGAYALSVTPAALATAALAEPVDARPLAALRQRHEGVRLRPDLDVRDLAQTGWAIVLPAAAPDSAAGRDHAAILDALRPLLDLRKAQATRRHADLYREFTGLGGHRPGESWQRFLARHGAGPGPAEPDKVPYYLLLVGDPQELSFRFQSQLGLHHAVGRLWFPDVAGYGHYARSLVAAETRTAHRPRRLLVAAAAHPDDPVTLADAARLDPLVDCLRGDPTLAGWTLERPPGPTRLALIDRLRDAPALLLAAGHGLVFPPGDPLELRHQGALLCHDWPGPRGPHGPVAERHCLAGEHLPPDLDLTGSLVVLCHSHGLGNPDHDELARQAGRPAPTPFLAALPTALLARPQGAALGVIGHVGRAWEHHAPGGDDPFAPLEPVLRGLMLGVPVGAAMDVLDARHAELAVRLEDLRARADASPADLARTWTALNAARGRVLLGDPAARLPLGDVPPSATPDEQSTIDIELASDSVIVDLSAFDEPARPPPVKPAPAAPAPAQPEPEPERRPNLLERLFHREDPRPAPAPEPEAHPPDLVDSLHGLARKLGETISGALADMSNLEVRTYVTADMDQFFVDEGTMRGAELRAYTRISLDGDTLVCVPERDGEVDRAVLDIHTTMVRQAQDARMELLRTLVQVTSSLTGPRK